MLRIRSPPTHHQHHAGRNTSIHKPDATRWSRMSGPAVSRDCWEIKRVVRCSGRDDLQSGIQYSLDSTVYGVHRTQCRPLTSANATLNRCELSIRTYKVPDLQRIFLLSNLLAYPMWRMLVYALFRQTERIWQIDSKAEHTYCCCLARWLFLLMYLTQIGDRFYYLLRVPSILVNRLCKFIRNQVINAMYYPVRWQTEG